MMRGGIIECFVKFKGEKYFQRVAKTSDEMYLQDLEEELNDRSDVEEIYFVDYLTGISEKTIFDILENRYEYNQSEGYNI